MAISSKVKIAAILANALIFIVVAVINYFSTSAGTLFPKATGKVSDENNTEITPAGSTFTIWAFIYMYQLAWVVYSMTLLCRNAPDILSSWFYASFSLANIFNLSWLLAWSREYLVIAFVFIVLIALALELTIYFSFKGLDIYIQSFPRKDEFPSTSDVWCIRLLIQNGLVFYTTWVSVATCLNLTIVIQYDLGANGSKAATGALCVLLLLIIGWFVLENFVLEKYTRFVFTEYIVLIVALSGILKKNWTDGSGNQAFVLSLLVLSSILLVVRLFIILIKEKRNANSSEKLRLIVRA